MDATELKAALAEFKAAREAAENLDMKKEASEARLADLSVSGNLEDDAVLNEISRLQIFTQLFPSRISAYNARYNDSVDGIRTTINGFIGQLRRRSAKLADGARDKVSESLRGHFQDAKSLSVAVSQSSLVKQAEEFKQTGILESDHSYANRDLDADGLIRKGEALLKSGEQLEAFAKANGLEWPSSRQLIELP
ncbi:MAG: hypothetical protein U1F65_05145 [Verrucomicrobiota bacterium]